MGLSVVRVLSITLITSATSIWRVIECAKDTRVIELVDFGDGAFDADMPVAARVVSRARAPAAFAARAVQGNRKTCEFMRAFFFSEMLERVDAFAVLLGRKRRVAEVRGRILKGLSAKVKSPKKSEIRGVVYRARIKTWFRREDGSTSSVVHSKSLLAPLPMRSDLTSQHTVLIISVEVIPRFSN